jgi:hypothetical protein
MLLTLIGLAIRADTQGVTSVVRAFGLGDTTYKAILNLFHSRAFSLEKFTNLWISLCFKIFCPVTAEGLTVLVADGLKVPKEGKKMPGRKRLHQESKNNSKPEYIMGHSIQVISILVKSICGKVFAAPLIGRIHEGLVFTNRDKRTTIDKMAEELKNIVGLAKMSIILVVDNFYGNEKIFKALKKCNSFLISRLRKNAVGYYPGTPKKPRKNMKNNLTFGERVELFSFFDKPKLFKKAKSPVYGETDVTISHYSIDLLWKPVGELVRFVFVNHPIRGKIILMTNHFSLDDLTVIRLYGFRFKIEVSFKQAICSLGFYAYHFWMKALDKIPNNSGDQFLHRQPLEYRRSVKRKIDAFHRYIQFGCVVQGVLIFLATKKTAAVWKNFDIWMRTIRKNSAPSESIVAQALRSSFPRFLRGSVFGRALMLFLHQKGSAQKIQCLAASVNQKN